MKSDETQGNELVVTGVGVGATGLVGAAVLGVTCPACVVVAPALVGAGLYKRWRSKRRARLDLERDDDAGAPVARGPPADETT